MNQKAVIAMSGGVDSSVAAYLMKEKGYECIGITIKTFNETGDGIKRENTCCERCEKCSLYAWDSPLSL